MPSEKQVWVHTEKGFVLQDTPLPDGISPLDVYKTNPPKFDLVDDFSHLSHLNEPSVLHTLQNRYKKDQIYTYSGLFLLAANPYKKLRFYDDKTYALYAQSRKSDTPPHIYAITGEAYRQMLHNNEDQSILITGESGAGKTENTKYAIEFLTKIGSDCNKTNYDASNYNKIATQVLHTNTILECFGNAMTVKNNNSSRFGKFVTIGFENGKIRGCRIEKYLLEKSRVTNTNSKERNYHIFYEIFTDKELCKEFGLTSIDDYRILKNTKKSYVIDDAKEFEMLKKSLQILEIQGKPYFSIVAAILKLSNLKFEERNDKVEIVGHSSSELLGLDNEQFKSILLSPEIKAGVEIVKSLRSTAQCEAVVDGLCRILYDTLFESLISEINSKLYCACSRSIGILDIAGFEIFRKNSFEQLCINYTNEKLQQFFNHHVFVNEQKIYKEEELKWDYVDFGLDLQPTIDLIEKSNPVGILSFLDEQCLMPMGSTDALDNNLKRIENSKLQYDKLKRVFLLSHYAGVVPYDTRDWIAKNKDPFFENLVVLLKNSKIEFVRKMFSKIESGTTQRGFFRTVSQVYKNQLKLLMERLSTTNPHFVRCILPNCEKKCELFNEKMVLEQLRCNGVMEGIRISRMGFPNRMKYDDFVKRYSVFLSLKGLGDAKNEPITTETTNPITITLKIMKHLEINENFYRVGKTRIFFKTEVLADIEEMRERRIRGVVLEMQSLVRLSVFAYFRKKKSLRLNALCEIQTNAALAVTFWRWGWLRLHRRLKPLIDLAKKEEQMRLKTEEINELRQKVEILTKKDKEKEKLLLERKIVFEGLERDLISTEGRLRKKEEEKEKYEETIKDLQRKNEEIKNLSQKSNEQNVLNLRRELERQIEKLKNEIISLKNELNDCEVERNQFEKETRNLKEVERDLHSQVFTKNDKIAALELTISNLENTSFVRASEEETNLLKVAELETALKRITAQLKKEKHMSHGNEIELSRVKQINEELIQKSIEQMTKREEEHLKEKNSLQHKLKMLEMQMRTYSEESEDSGLDKLMNELENERSSRAELERKYNDLIFKSNNMVSNAPEEVPVYGNEKIKKQVFEMKKKLSDFYSNTVDLVKEFMEKNRKSEFDCDLLRVELEVYQNSKTEGVTVLQCDESYCEMQEKLKEFAINNETLKSKHKALVEENKNKEEELRKLFEVLENLKTEINQKNKEIVSFQQNRSNYETVLQKLRIYEKEHEKYKELLYCNESVNKENFKENNKVIGELNENGRRLGEIIVGLRNEIKELKIMCGAGEVRICELMREVGDTKRLVDILKGNRKLK